MTKVCIMLKKLLICFLLTACWSIQASRSLQEEERLHSSLIRLICNKPESYVLEFIQHTPMGSAYLNAQDCRGNTALIIASSLGRTDIVRALLNKGAVIGIKNRMGHDARSVSSNRTIQAILYLYDNRR